MMTRLAYGELPNRHSFDLHYREYYGDKRTSFWGDSRLGTCLVSRDGLWEELQKAQAEWFGATAESYAGSNAAGEWCARVLFSIGIIWV
jgi:hypothetical protein